VSNLVSSHISTIEALNPSSPYTATQIAHLLAAEQIELEHGGMFTGRPGTRIHCSEDQVLKLHEELHFDQLSSQRWIKQTVEKERRYHVYHPDKTWFLYHDVAQDRYLIGNITPKLQPLHNIFRQDDLDLSYALSCFEGLFRLYFQIAQQHQLRLDEGLSNFAVNLQGQVFYLDDDIYTWDQQVTLSQMMGVYMRSLDWIQGDIAGQLGSIINAVIQNTYGDNQNSTVLSEQLRDLFLPKESQQQALIHLREALAHQKPRVDALNLIKSERYVAILADIHANLPALDAVLEWLSSNQIKAGLVLGDLVGYGPHPQACVQRLRAYDFVFLKGNHDNALATGNFKKGFSTTSSWALNWSNSRVRDEDKHWLSTLLSVLHHDDWIALHGAPIDPTFFNAYVYKMTFEHNLDHLEQKKIAVCFHGHSHMPGIYGRKLGMPDDYYLDDDVDLNQFQHCLVCPGSIGQPRNQQAQVAQFAIYDQQERKIAFQALPYDTLQTLTDMKAAAFPDSLIRIIEDG